MHTCPNEACFWNELGTHPLLLKWDSFPSIVLSCCSKGLWRGSIRAMACSGNRGG